MSGINVHTYCNSVQCQSIPLAAANCLLSEIRLIVKQENDVVTTVHVNTLCAHSSPP